jgi:hypothetical protein
MGSTSQGDRRVVSGTETEAKYVMDVMDLMDVMDDTPKDGGFGVELHSGRR